MVAVKLEVEEVQMSLNLFDGTNTPEAKITDPNDTFYKQQKEQSVIDAVHEMMGGKLLGKFINITKDNEEEYLKAYAEAKQKLHLSQFRTLSTN